MSEVTGELADRLIAKRLESPELDYKGSFDETTGAWMELAKDIYGMANYGAGFIVIGVEDKSFLPRGSDPTFHISAQIWIDKVSKWAT